MYKIAQPLKIPLFENTRIRKYNKKGVIKKYCLYSPAIKEERANYVFIEELNLII